MAYDPYDERGQGPTPPADDDGWGDFDTSWESPQSGDFGGQDDFTPQDDGGGQGSFIPQDDDGWGSTSGFTDQQLQTTGPDEFTAPEVDIPQRFQPKQVKLSMKMVAVIILAICVVVALIFAFTDKIHFNKKPSTPNNPGTVETQQPQQGNQPQQNDGQNQQQGGNSQGNAGINSVTLVEIPDSTQLNYNGDILTANGKVANKLKYVQGHQVLYCINVTVAFGSQSQTISYYCNYSSFNAVKEGDIVVLNYQQVNDSYISVVSISK